ncbi:sulfoxide reductase catalytic subunit YedY [bacterium MnTg02]|nr:sulfoxide reductase catalytic subunit YedY [bacterium MnTg02]
MGSQFNRRRFLQIGAFGFGAAGLSLGPLANLTRAGDVQVRVGPPTRAANRLVALPGKRPLIQIYDRPPVYETPSPLLIGDEIYPLTNRDAYYVRWREALIPQIKPEELRLIVAGDAVVNPRTFTLNELQQEFSETSVAAVGACKGMARGVIRPVLGGVPWGIGDVSAAKWTGIRVKDLLESVGVKDTAVQVAFKAAGETIAVSERQYWRVQAINEMTRPEPILAYKMNDREMPLWNGAPLRLVNPGEYSPEWVKQVVRIEVRSTPLRNLWAGTKVGGRDPIKITSLVTVPEAGQRLQSDHEHILTGVAYDSGIGIAKVEVSTDGGATWQTADMEKSYGKYVWRVWHHRFTPDRKGSLTILSRATGVTEETQPNEPLLKDVTDNGRRMNSVMAFGTRVEVV